MQMKKTQPRTTLHAFFRPLTTDQLEAARLGASDRELERPLSPVSPDAAASGRIETSPQEALDIVGRPLMTLSPTRLAVSTLPDAAARAGEGAIGGEADEPEPLPEVAAGPKRRRRGTARLLDGAVPDWNLGLSADLPIAAARTIPFDNAGRATVPANMFGQLLTACEFLAVFARNVGLARRRLEFGS